MARKLPSKMASMELDDEEKLDAAMPIPISNKPDYPYGLQICLSDKEFEKLGVDPSEAEVGGIFHLHGLARITSVSSHESEGHSHLRVEAQIEDLSIESEDDENEDEDDKD